jgi:transposase InsO family protein
VEIHGNARLLPRQRALLCERVRVEGWTVNDVAEAFGVSERTVYRWLARYDAGEPMTDRSSAPKSRPTKTSAELEALIEQLRRQRWTAPRIAGELNMATSTVCAVLKRIGLNRLWRLEPPEPPNRGAGRGNRGIGWEFCHVAIDDTSRLAYVEILDDEKASTCVAFLRRAIGYFAAHGVTVERVMTDNGTGYRSHAHRAAIAELKIKHLRTQPYRPRTNGKAERFIQTLQREWAYAIAYDSSWHRRRALLPWLNYYNNRRPHSALSHKTPASQITAD